MLPADVDVRILLARAYAESGRKAEALVTALSVLEWSREDQQRAKLAADLITNVETCNESR